MSVTHHGGVSRPHVSPNIHRGSTTPVGNLGDLWVDTSIDPPELKLCTDTSPMTWDAITGGGPGGGLTHEEIMSRVSLGF